MWLFTGLHAVLITKFESSGGTCLLAVIPRSLCAGCVSTMPLADGRVAVNTHGYGLSEKAVGKEMHESIAAVCSFK